MKPPERLAADDPREWLNRAKSNLRLASRHCAPHSHIDSHCYQTTHWECALQEPLIRSVWRAALILVAFVVVAVDEAPLLGRTEGPSSAISSSSSTPGAADVAAFRDTSSSAFASGPSVTRLGEHACVPSCKLGCSYGVLH